MKRTLILGADELLGVELAAQLLQSGADPVMWIVGEADDGVQNALSNLVMERVDELSQGPGRAPSASQGRGRLEIVAIPPGPPPPAVVSEAPDLAADEVWCLEEWHAALRSALPAGPASDTASLLECVRTPGINKVSSIDQVDGRPPREEPDEVKSLCASRGIHFRGFHLAMLVGDRCVRTDSAGCNILGFLHALDELTEEIEERSPEFFDYFALRLLAPQRTAWNLVSVRRAVQRMLHIAAGNDPDGGEHYVLSSRDTPLDDFCALVSECCGVSILATHDAGALNAIDRLFASRWKRFSAGCDSFVPEEMRALASRAAGGLEPPDAGEDLLRSSIASILRRQSDARAVRKRRVAQLAAGLQRKVVARPGGELAYFCTCSQGPPLVVLNALGQGLDYWYRLSDQLGGRYRILLWEARGLTPDSAPLRLVDHVEDLKAVLDAERYEACYLLGWCTGPQLAMEFYRRFPQAVLKMAFLNTACRVPDRPDLETPYGVDLEMLCESIQANPALAASVMNSLSAPPQNEIDLAGATDAHQVAAEVLALTNVHLRGNVLAPFRSAETTRRYAAQMLDLASTETVATAPEIQVPLLVIGCEYDKVALAAKSAEIAKRFPRATHVELPGATHYAFFDHPAGIAKLLNGFFSGSENPRTA